MALCMHVRKTTWYDIYFSRHTRWSTTAYLKPLRAGAARAYQVGGIWRGGRRDAMGICFESLQVKCLHMHAMFVFYTTCNTDRYNYIWWKIQLHMMKVCTESSIHICMPHLLGMLTYTYIHTCTHAGHLPTARAPIPQQWLFSRASRWTSQTTATCGPPWWVKHMCSCAGVSVLRVYVWVLVYITPGLGFCT